MTTETSILVVDDHPIIGMAMDILIQKHFPKTIVEKADGGKMALQVLKNKEFDLIILDVNLPDYDIISLIPNIFRIKEDQKILVFTMTPENILAKRLFLMKVMGFLSKNVADEEIVEAIRKVLRGERYVSKDFSHQMMQDFLDGTSNINPFETLSDREYQVLKGLLSGESAKMISDKMNLHHSSVNTYKNRIYAKLNIENHVELYEKAKAYGLI